MSLGVHNLFNTSHENGTHKTMLPNLGGLEEDGFCSKHDGWKAQGTYIHA